MTLQDIADALQVHVTTVSKALLGRPGIAPATSRKVAAMAREMGYVPDPRLRALADYRAEKRKGVYRANLAWVHGHGRDEPMERFPAYGDYWRGALLRAQALGYALDPYWAPGGEGGMRRLLRTLEARGVPGLVLAPQARVSSIEGVDWSAFSVVAVGFTLVRPAFHRVSTDHFRLIIALIERLEAEGSRRIGFYLKAEEQERTERRMTAAAANGSVRSEVFVKTFEEADRRSFSAWRSRHRLDTVVTGSLAVAAWVKTAKAPVRVVAYAFQANEEGVPGMYHNNCLIGDHAVSLLDAMVRRGEKGVPDTAIELLVEAKWASG